MRKILPLFILMSACFSTNAHAQSDRDIVEQLARRHRQKMGRHKEKKDHHHHHDDDDHKNKYHGHHKKDHHDDHDDHKKHKHADHSVHFNALFEFMYIGQGHFVGGLEMGFHPVPELELSLHLMGGVGIEDQALPLTEFVAESTYYFSLFKRGSMSLALFVRGEVGIGFHFAPDETHGDINIFFTLGLRFQVGIFAAFLDGGIAIRAPILEENPTSDPPSLVNPLIRLAFAIGHGHAH